MNDAANKGRLKTEYDNIQARCVETPYTIEPAEGQTPPYIERYRASFPVPTNTEAGNIIYEDVLVTIDLMLSFPNTPPIVWVLTRNRNDESKDSTYGYEIPIQNWSPEMTLVEVLEYISSVLGQSYDPNTTIENEDNGQQPVDIADAQDRNRKPKISVISIEKDSRPITVRTAPRTESNEYIRSKQYGLPKRSEVRLFIETEACRQIFEFIEWDKRTHKNRIEQAALMYGRLCEAKGLFTTKRWGEVCGIIPIQPDKATEVSINISAADWAYASQQLDDINHEVISQNGEEYVIIGWMHTHPNTLEVSFSSLDVSLQKHIMNNDNMFGVVFNPHRRIFACYADADSKCCRAVIVADAQLREEYHLDEAKTSERLTQEPDDSVDTPMLQLKAMHKRDIPDRVPTMMYDVHGPSYGKSYPNLKQQKPGSLDLTTCRNIASVIRTMQKPESAVSIVIYYDTGELVPVAYIPNYLIAEARRMLRQKNGYYIFSIVTHLPIPDELATNNAQWGLWPENTYSSSLRTFENTIYYCDNHNSPQACLLFNSMRY